MALEARSLRRDLEAVDGLLDDLDWGLRRRVRLLLGHVTAQQLALRGSSGTLAIGIAKLSSTARVDIAMLPPPGDDPWHDLVDPHIEHLAAPLGPRPPGSRRGLVRARPGAGAGMTPTDAPEASPPDPESTPGLLADDRRAAPLRSLELDVTGRGLRAALEEVESGLGDEVEERARRGSAW